MSDEIKPRAYHVMKMVSRRLVPQSHARLREARITENPGGFLCGGSNCVRVHTIRLARVHRVHKNLKLYACSRRGCFNGLFKVNSPHGREEYKYSKNQQ